MNTMRRVLMISLAAVAAFAGSTVVAADANVAGVWTMTVETSQGSGTPTFNLKQDGKAITGSYKGSLGEAPVTGTIDGNAITLKYNIATQGVELTVTYSGTVDGATMKGKVVLGEFGEGTFSGKKS